MPQGEEDQVFDAVRWQKLALSSADAGLWEWDHRRDTVRLCTGAAVLLAGDTALAWRDLSLEDALARVHADDIGQLRVRLSMVAYPSSVQIGRYRVHAGANGTRRVLLRGRTYLGAGGEPSVTMGVVFDITETEPDDEGASIGPGADHLDRAAHHGIAAYNAIRASGVATLLSPARALLLAIGQEIASGLKFKGGRLH